MRASFSVARRERLIEFDPTRDLTLPPGSDSPPDNAREATKQLGNPPVDMGTLPFDPIEYINFELPWDGLDAD